MAESQISFEFFAGLSILVTIGSAWAHLAVKLDRIHRSTRHHGRCLKRLRIRMAKAERWLPPK